MAPTSDADGLSPWCPWCLEVAPSDHDATCTALDLHLRLLLASDPPADPPVATQVEHWLWDQGYDPDDRPPPF